MVRRGPTRRAGAASRNRTTVGRPSLNIHPDPVFFDMDHTLIDNDCDVSWKTFLVSEGFAPPDSCRLADLFYEQYRQGALDIERFLAFQLAEFRGNAPEEMARLARRHYEAAVRETVYEEARLEVERALTQGRRVALLTATNEVIAAPIARAFGIEHVLATRLEMSDGRYTGAIEGVYCHGKGKIVHARAFCRQWDCSLETAAYYGDSTSDIPMLAAVGHPVAVNPGPDLTAAAKAEGWPIRQFENT